MAHINIDGDALVVKLSALEKVGAVHGDVHVSLQKVKRAWVAAEPWSELRGMRMPGTGLPMVIMLGTMRGSFGKDFCAVYGRKPALVVALEGAAFSRLVVTVEQPELLAQRVAEQRS